MLPFCSCSDITSSFAGIIITDLICGRNSPYESVFDPARVRARALPQMLKHDIRSLDYKDYLTPGDISDIEDLPPCSGAVMRCGPHKVAVYRDAEGKVHQMSAVCPHLKSIVRWNSDEQSFDCPAYVLCLLRLPGV